MIPLGTYVTSLMYLTVLFNVPMMFNECLLASLGEGALLVFETWRSSAIDSINLKTRLLQFVFCLFKMSEL